MSIKVIHNTDLGTGLAVENNKVVVKFPEVAEAVSVTSFTKTGSVVTISLSNGTSLPVDLADLIPAAKADRFLREVSYVEAEQAFKFVTSVVGEADTELKVPVGDVFANIVKVSTEAGNALVKKEDGTLYVPTITVPPALTPAELLAEIKKAPTFAQDFWSSVKGEEVQDLAGNTKGYLIKTSA